MSAPLDAAESGMKRSQASALAMVKETPPAGSVMNGRTAPQSGLAWGVWIHRRVPPKRWPQELERVPPEHRQVAEQYLRGIAARMRVVRAVRKTRTIRDDGPREIFDISDAAMQDT